MGLVTNLKLFFPDTPSPPDPKVVEISAALDLAILNHIITAYVPAGFGQTFISGITSPTVFINSLGAYLTSILSPVLSSALSIESTPGSNHFLAWGVVQPSFDALSISAPPFMAGIDGLKLWQAIILTIRTGIIPEFPVPESDDAGEIGGSGIITPEVEL